MPLGTITGQYFSSQYERRVRPWDGGDWLYAFACKHQQKDFISSFGFYIQLRTLNGF